MAQIDQEDAHAQQASRRFTNTTLAMDLELSHDQVGKCDEQQQNRLIAATGSEPSPQVSRSPSSEARSPHISARADGQRLTERLPYDRCWAASPLEMSRNGTTDMIHRACARGGGPRRPHHDASITAYLQ